MHNCKCCTLQGSLNLMASNCKLFCLSLSQFYWKSNDTFYYLIQDSSYVLSTSSAHFGMTFAYFWILILRNKPNKDSTEALVRKASDWTWRCQRGLGNIYISTGFLSAFSFCTPPYFGAEYCLFAVAEGWLLLDIGWFVLFLKIPAKALLNIQLWLCIWPLCTFTDRILQTRGDDTFWCMQWKQERDCWIDYTLLY